MKTAYYAHAKLLYGTREEKEQRAFIEAKFDRVICPNRDIGELGNIKDYLKIIEKKCTHVVCTEFLDTVGRGVWEEVKYARKLKLPIYCVRKDGIRYRFLKVRSGRVIDGGESWTSYAKLNCEELK